MERSIFSYIHNLAGQSGLLDFLGIFLAEYSGYLIFLVAILIISSEPDWRKKFLNYSTLALSLILSRGLITEAIRAVYYRARPFIELGFVPLADQANTGAFPSGHASFYFALAGVIWTLDRKWGNRLFFAVFLMGLARIYIGVHWPTDILGGLAVGLLSVWLVTRLLKIKIR